MMAQPDRPIRLFDASREFESHREELLGAGERVLRSGTWILGPEVQSLETDVADFLQVEHAVGVASGSDALVLALRTLAVGPGDLVVTTPFTFVATAAAIANAGARPVFVDVDPVTLNLDPRAVRLVLEGRSPIHTRVGARPDGIKAIIPVHLFGMPAEMREFVRLREDFGVAIIEDAAQAFGTTCDDRFAGALGDVGCFSFFPTKNLGGFGDGGMVVTDSDEHAERLRLLRSHGARAKYLPEVVGTNSRLDALQAALLRVELRHLERSLAARRAHAAAYDAELRALDGLATPVFAPGRTYHQYVVALRERNRIREALAARGIETAVHYPSPLHVSRAFADLGYHPGDFPHAEEASRKVLSLPIFPTMTDAERSAVIAAIIELTGGTVVVGVRRGERG